MRSLSRTTWLLAVCAVVCLGAIAAAAALSSHGAIAPSAATEAALAASIVRATPPDPPSPRNRPPDHVLVQLYRGRTEPSRRDVSITTIFHERSFTVVADPDLAAGAEEDLQARIREIFSLGQIDSLGSSIVALAGGSAVLDDDGGRIEIRVEGQAVGGQAARLIVTQMQDGREQVASSVIARAGKTVVLAGQPTDAPGGGRDIYFVCLTPFR